MLVTERDRLQKEIEQLADKLGRSRTSLIPLLQEVTRRSYHVDGYAMQVIADLLNVPPAEVYGVVTFYAFLSDRPQGQFAIRLCRTISCDMQNKDAVARQLKNDLGVDFGETTADGKFTLEWANCMGMCDQGPALLVNDRIYTRVTPEKVHEIIQACRRTFGAHRKEVA